VLAFSSSFTAKVSAHLVDVEMLLWT